jgi:uncharacterized protein (TIGR04255 family)
MGTPLRNPPVFLTLVQVRFSPILKLDAYIPSIQEALRKDYPDFNEATEVGVKITIVDGQPKPEPDMQQRWFLGDQSKRHQFVLHREALTLQSTDYGTFESFSERFQKGLEVVHNVAALSLVSRIGLRYLDRVAPMEADEKLEQYLVPGAMGLTSALEGAAEHSFCETLTKVGDVKLRARVFIRDSGLAVPPDVGVLELNVADRFKGKQLHAVVDSDGFVDLRASFTMDVVQRYLGEIHEVIGKAFKNITTSHAREMWNR